MAVGAGRFREVVRIERPKREANTFGEKAITDWELVDEVFAEVIQPTSPDRTHEVASASRPATERLLQFRLRTPVDIDASYRIVWNDEPYGVEGSLPDPAKGETLVTGRFLSETDGR